MRILRAIAPAVAAVAISACAGNSLGTLGDILGGVLQPAGTGQAQQLSVEVLAVNTQQQGIQLRTSDGQTGWVRYDANTAVWYRQQQYPVTALERGDLGVAHVQQDASGNVYVSRIDVTQSAQDRTDVGGAVGVQQLSGRITQIDHTNGWFVMQTSAGSVTVTLPYNPPQATLDYFHRLRVGNDVRLEARVTGTGRAEIHRFL